MRARLETILTGLLSCLRDSLYDRPVCSLTIQNGPTVIADRVGCSPAVDGGCDCDGDGCGMGWVRLVDVHPFPAGSLTSVDTAPRGCTPVLAATIEVGVLRCLAPMKIGVPPAEAMPADAEVIDDALTAAADAAALFAAARCCGPVLGDAKDVVLGVWRPIAGGDAGGGTLTITVALRAARGSAVQGVGA